MKEEGQPACRVREALSVYCLILSFISDVLLICRAGTGECCLLDILRHFVFLFSHQSVIFGKIINKAIYTLYIIPVMVYPTQHMHEVG